MTIVNGVYLGKDISNLPGFQDSDCLNLQRALSKRLTLSAVLIFVTEGWFTYIYFLSFEENHRNRGSDFQSWKKDFSNDFTFFQ